MPNDPENEVLGRFTQGDPAAFEALFRHHEAEVFRWALRIVRDPAAAEDVAIEAFWRAYRGRARFDASRSFGAWLRRITTNAALDHLRSTRGRRDWATTDDDTPAPAATDGALRESIMLAFQRLRLACGSSRHWRSSNNSRTRRSPTRWTCPSAPSSRASPAPSRACGPSSPAWGSDHER